MLFSVQLIESVVALSKKVYFEDRKMTKLNVHITKLNYRSAHQSCRARFLEVLFLAACEGGPMKNGALKHF
jgi:hypothetical protein